jgi:plastocyanin
LVDRVSARVDAVERRYADLDETTAPKEVLDRAEAEYLEASRLLPSFDPYRNASAANWLQPCYLTRGSPPTAADTACPKREQPDFSGRESYYSSGFIAPSGTTGNTYRLPLADDAEPGSYRFICIVHPEMEGRLIVKPEGSDVASPSELNAAARRQIEELASPLREAFAAAKAGRARYGDGERIRLPMGGFHSADVYTVALDEFIPKTMTSRVGEPVTWTLFGAHTVSFGVPRYVPIYTVSPDGTVRRNPTVDRPAGGSPKAPPVDFEHETYRIDGGTWDGTGFISSGLLGSEPFSLYTLRFGKPGRYRYACLVHPPMAGTLIVRP